MQLEMQERSPVWTLPLHRRRAAVARVSTSGAGCAEGHQARLSARLCEVLHSGCQRRQHRVHASVSLRHGRAKVATGLQRDLGVSRLGRLKQRPACRAGGSTQLRWEWPHIVDRRVCDAPVRRTHAARSAARAHGLWRGHEEPQRGRRAAPPRSCCAAAAERWSPRMELLHAACRRAPGERVWRRRQLCHAGSAHRW